MVEARWLAFAPCAGVCPVGGGGRWTLGGGILDLPVPFELLKCVLLGLGDLPELGEVCCFGLDISASPLRVTACWKPLPCKELDDVNCAFGVSS